MSTTLHVGKKRVNTVGASDGTTPPPGSVTVTAQLPSIVTATVDAQNNVTVTGVSAGTSNVTYAANGLYNPVTETYVVAPLPTLVVTDGAEQ